MRKLIILAFFNLALGANAQPIDIPSNKNTDFPNSAISPNALDTRPANFEEYLVQLAWKNSFELEGAKYEIDARGQEIKLAEKDWTKNLQAGFNLNEVSFPYLKSKIQGLPFDKQTVTSYPLWNVGAGVNIGEIIVRKNKIKYAENKKKISESDLNFKKQKLRGEVLKRYQEYLNAFDIIKVRIQALDAAEAIKNQIQSLFSVNKVQFEDYNTANKAYYDALESKVRGEADIKLKRIAIEELIGTKWENVERVKGNYDDKKQNIDDKKKTNEEKKKE